MIERARLVSLHRGDRELICGWLDELIGVVPRYLAEARDALAVGDPNTLEAALHDAKNAISAAGAQGRLLSVAVEALAICGTATAPRIPDPPDHLRDLLGELEKCHAETLADASRLRDEFAQ